MKSINSIALAAFAATATFVAPVNACTYCERFDGFTVCGETLSPTVDRVGAEFDSGARFYVDVTCTADQWMIHGGEWQNMSQQQADAIAAELAEGFCEGRGSHFISA